MHKTGQVGQIEDKFKEISAQIKTFVNMKIRDLAQGSQGKLLKWILILLTLVFIGNHIYVNFIAILPGTTIIIIIIVVYLILIIIKIIVLIAIVILSLYSQNRTFC